MVDTALARAFESVGVEYDTFRPGFPFAAVEAAVPRNVTGVLDLGAGTGKLTEILAQRFAEVVAVDPSVAMLDVLRDKLPGVDARVGTAEAIPVTDATVQAVTVAQAFHWFDREAACAEIARVLQPGGTLGLLWNQSDPECTWDRACHRVAHPAVDEEDRTTGAAADALPGFQLVEQSQFAWTEEISRSDYIGRWGTVSTFLVASPDRRRDMIAALESILDDDPATRGRSAFGLPHRTEVFLYRRS